MSTSALVSDSSSVPSPTMELRITWNTNRVLRPARRGLKAVLCQNRVREDNADEPQAAEPDLLRQRTGHLDLVRSRPRAMPTEFPSREGHRATRVSRTARASAGTRALPTPSRTTDPDSTRIARELTQAYPLASSPSPPLEPTRQEVRVHPLWPLLPKTTDLLE